MLLWRLLVKKEVFGLSLHALSWAARYNTWLLIKLTPKGVVFSFLFFSFACPLRKLLRFLPYSGRFHSKATLLCHWSTCISAGGHLLLGFCMCCDQQPCSLTYALHAFTVILMLTPATLQPDLCTSCIHCYQSHNKLARVETSNLSARPMHYMHSLPSSQLHQTCQDGLATECYLHPFITIVMPYARGQMKSLQ